MKIFYVAKLRDSNDVPLYACYEAGVVVATTKDIYSAKKFISPGAIMNWMGGHYSSFQAVKCHEEIVEIETVDFPPEETADVEF